MRHAVVGIPIDIQEEHVMARRRSQFLSLAKAKYSVSLLRAFLLQ